MLIFNNINNFLFKEQITQNFINNISNLTCSTLANLISIDYLTRLNSRPSSNEYIQICTRKLKKYLGQKVITDDSFSTALTLFAVAITPDEQPLSNQNNILNQSIDTVIENLITINFSNKDFKLSVEEKNTIIRVLKNLAGEVNFNKIIDYIQAEPKLFYLNILYVSKKYKTTAEINLYMKNEITKILNPSLAVQKKTSFFKEITSKLVTAVCALALGGIGVVTAGAAFSLLLIPAAIFSLKYGPKIGEKIGQIFLNQNKTITAEINQINELKVNSQKNNIAFLKEAKQQEISRYQDRETVSPSQSIISKSHLNKKETETSLSK